MSYPFTTLRVAPGPLGQKPLPCLECPQQRANILQHVVCGLCCGLQVAIDDPVLASCEGSSS